MNYQPFRWVQVINTVLENGTIIQDVGTTMDINKRNGLDVLSLQHRKNIAKQYGDVEGKVLKRWIVWMSSNGVVSDETVYERKMQP